MSFNDLIIHGPIATRLCEYLPYISRIALKKACPNIRTQYDVWNFSKVIQEYLDKIGFKGKEICDILRDTPETVLSGSLLLKCLNNDDWQPNDMDVYSKARDLFAKRYTYKILDTEKEKTVDRKFEHNAFSHRLLQLGIIEYDLKKDNNIKFNIKPSVTGLPVDEQKKKFKKVVSKQEPLTDPVQMNKPTYDIDVDHDIKRLLKYDTLDWIFNVAQFKCKNMSFSFQDICVKKDHQISEVIDGFDMGFLQTTYDGKKIIIRNPHQVIKKKSTFIFGQRMFKFIMIKPYTSYDDEYVMYERYENAYTILKRIKKYRIRGYIVNIEDSILVNDMLEDNKEYNNILDISMWKKIIEMAKDITLHFDKYEDVVSIINENEVIKLREVNKKNDFCLEEGEEEEDVGDDEEVL